MKITLDDFRTAQSLITKRAHELKKENHANDSDATNQAYSELSDALDMDIGDLKHQMAMHRIGFKKSVHQKEVKDSVPRAKSHPAPRYIADHIAQSAVEAAGLLVLAQMLVSMALELQERIKKITVQD